MRMIRNEADTNESKCGTMDTPQMSRPAWKEFSNEQQADRPNHYRPVWAVANGVDSADKASGEFTPFLNIMNEWYLRDCSRKQVAAYQIRGRAGKPNTANALYGYRKDPDDKHARKRPPEEWMVFEDTHEAIVDPETWKLAQQIRREVYQPLYHDPCAPGAGAGRHPRGEHLRPL